MAVSLSNRFRKQLIEILGPPAKSHGYPLRTIEAAEERLGQSIPGVLRDYYLEIGRHKLNRIHNRLIEPDGLELHQGRLVFMDENQSVVCWGVRGRTKAYNPVVFQAVDREEGEWFAETRCSAFLSAMLCFHASAGLPYFGYSDQFLKATLSSLIQGWPLVGRVMEMSAYANQGKVLCVFIEGDNAFVQVGARTRSDYSTLIAELGIGIHAG